MFSKIARTRTVKVNGTTYTRDDRTITVNGPAVSMTTSYPSRKQADAELSKIVDLFITRLPATA